MAEPPRFRSSITSTLDHQADVALSLADESKLSKLLVRAAPDAPAMGTPFGSSTVDGGTVIAGLRPDEWLLLGPESEIETIVSRLPASGHVSVVDWTHARAAIRLTGVDATRALEKVCALDWSEPMTPDGAVTSASVAKVTSDIVGNDLAGVGHCGADPGTRANRWPRGHA